MPSLTKPDVTSNTWDSSNLHDERCKFTQVKPGIQSSAITDLPAIRGGNASSQFTDGNNWRLWSFYIFVLLLRIFRGPHLVVAVFTIQLTEKSN